MRLAFWSCTIALLLAAMPAQATVHNFVINLDGLQETPPVATPGTGTGTATLDDVTNFFEWEYSFQDLIGTTTDAHFHGPAAIGVGPAGIRLGVSFPAGVTSGSDSGSAILDNTQEAELLAGLWYLNIHSTFRPGGEIRGQVIIPEPATLGLLLVGGLAMLRRRS